MTPQSDQEYQAEHERPDGEQPSERNGADMLQSEFLHDITADPLTAGYISLPAAAVSCP